MKAQLFIGIKPETHQLVGQQLFGQVWGGVVELFFYFGKQFGGRTGRSEGRAGVERGNGRKAGEGGGRVGRLRGFDWENKAL